jgi:hypothetical protein
MKDERGVENVYSLARRINPVFAGNKGMSPQSSQSSDTEITEGSEG